MDSFKVIVFLVLVSFAATSVLGIAQNGNDSSIAGYGYEMIAAKLDYLQYKLIEMDLTMKEDRETTDQKLSQQETLSEGLLWAINQLSQTIANNLTVMQDHSSSVMKENREFIGQKLSGVTGTIYQLSQTIGHNLTALQTQSAKMLSQQTACANHAQMRKEIQMLSSEEHRSQLSIASASNSRKSIVRSCKMEPSQRSGKFLIQPTENDEPFFGYCEQIDFGGGWLVIQYRFNGLVDFYRNWTEYRNGFGNVDGEHWLGLERMHRLTSAKPHELLVEIKDFSGNYSYARYNDFQIGNETEQYPLAKLGSYSGTAGDSLTYHKGKKFTTKDRDNDENSSANCATLYGSAWWYSNCYKSNLNGNYMRGEDRRSMNWYYYKSNYQGLAYSRMLIRER